MQTGSAYRILPIQERPKRPLWAINNRASGFFVSCLWEHRENERACDEVRERGVEVVAVLICLCAHSFLQCESIAEDLRPLLKVRIKMLTIIHLIFFGEKSC